MASHHGVVTRASSTMTIGSGTKPARAGAEGILDKAVDTKKCTFYYSNTQEYLFSPAVRTDRSPNDRPRHHLRRTEGSDLARLPDAVAAAAAALALRARQAARPGARHRRGGRAGERGAALVDDPVRARARLRRLLADAAGVPEPPGRALDAVPRAHRDDAARARRGRAAERRRAAPVRRRGDRRAAPARGERRRRRAAGGRARAGRGAADPRAGAAARVPGRLLPRLCAEPARAAGPPARRPRRHAGRVRARHPRRRRAARRELPQLHAGGGRDARSPAASAASR